MQHKNSESFVHDSILFEFFNRSTFFKDNHREKAPSNETPALTKSTNMGIWVVGTTNQLCILRGS